MGGSLGPFEIFIIFLVILLVFGAKRIPEIARGLGKGIREFKTATKEIKDELSVDVDSTPSRTIQPPRHNPAPRTDSYQQKAAPEPAPQPAQSGDSDSAEKSDAAA